MYALELFSYLHEKADPPITESREPPLATPIVYTYVEVLPCSVVGGVDNAMTELDSGPHTLHFASPPAVVEPLLPLADEPRTLDDDEAISSLRAGPEEKNMEISTTPR